MARGISLSDCESAIKYLSMKSEAKDTRSDINKLRLISLCEELALIPQRNEALLISFCGYNSIGRELPFR